MRGDGGGLGEKDSFMWHVACGWVWFCPALPMFVYLGLCLVLFKGYCFFFLFFCFLFPVSHFLFFCFLFSCSLVFLSILYLSSAYGRCHMHKQLTNACFCPLYQLHGEEKEREERGPHYFFIFLALIGNNCMSPFLNIFRLFH